MRKCLALVLLVTFSWIGGLGQDARAGVTFDVVFQDGTGGTLTIAEGDPGPGCTFTGYYGLSVSTGRCMDVVVRTTVDFVMASVSVQYDNNNGLAYASLYEWRPVEVAPSKYCAPTDGIVDWGPGFGSGKGLKSFDCTIFPPFNPPVVAAGTYRVGTIVWDTSGTTAGTETIAAFIDSLYGNGFFGVINGNLVDLSSSVWVNSAVLNIISEVVAPIE